MPTVESVLQNFVFRTNTNLKTHEFEQFLKGNKVLTSHDIGNAPESWTEDNLIWPLIEAVGLEKDPQPYRVGDRPDFELLNSDVEVLGEIKSPNKIEDAEDDIKEYLRDKALGADHGIATDGINWVIYKIELGGDFVQYPEIDSVSLRKALLGIADDMGVIVSEEDIDIEEQIEKFTDIFEVDVFNKLLTEKAPQRLRDERKRDVEEFYDLYIELLFGAGKNNQYDTTLLDDINSPHGATENDERVFAITLVNRLLFIKFLEEKNVLHDGFLLSRVESYEDMQDEFAGSLYDTQISPLFNDLLNTPKDDRAAKYKGDDKWFSKVPYLNGGLFHDSVDDEGKYRVQDRILPTVIKYLIEGSALDMANEDGLDPAIVGSVFEKTINYLEQERSQKDIGAYYTPTDVTALITKQTVDPKLKDELLQVYGDAVSIDSEEFIASNEEKELEKILRDIEDGAGWFGDPDATREALDRLNELTVLDPACGSGHFLTTALDELHRVQLTLLKGLHGDDLQRKKIFEENKKLALNSIYGVDIEPVGVEITKLRIWLKIIENGWQDGFGKLPNIDVNISAGNSLTGLPVTGPRTSTLDMIEFRDRIRDVVDLRLEYKFEDADEKDRNKIERIQKQKLRPELDELCIEQQNYTVETEIQTVEQFNEVIESIDGQNLHPTIESIQARPTTGGSITDSQDERLEDYGFSTYSKSARLDINQREQVLRSGNGENSREQIVEELRTVLESGFVFSEMVRQPVKRDLERTQGPAFHWIAEFPEVADIDEMTADFDIILGNPPYGDILDDTAKVLVNGYETGSVRDVSAQFVERQLQLLDEDGYFGNITTLRLVVQSSLSNFHDLLREKMQYVDIASFGYRPSYVFDNAEIQVAIFTGQKGTEDRGTISTSEFVWLQQKQRTKQLSEISYADVDGYVLSDKIGGRSDTNYQILPKIGTEEIQSILDVLESHSETDSLFGDVYDREREVDVDDEELNRVWRREGLLYWVNPMLEKLYDAREVKPMYFDSELEQKTAFMVMNSSLFYLYWVVYGNQRHLNWGQIKAFPFPDREVIEENEERIIEDADELWEGMKVRFNEDTRHFHTANMKPLIDDFERDVMSELYGLSDEQVELLTSFYSEHGREEDEPGVDKF